MSPPGHCRGTQRYLATSAVVTSRTFGCGCAALRDRSRILRTSLSAAQPKPKDRGEINAFVPGLALRRAALKGATSSPTGVQMRVGSVAEKFEGKSLEALADLQFPRRLPSIILDSKAAPGDNLSKLAV